LSRIGILKGMTGALAPFSYLVHVYSCKVLCKDFNWQQFFDEIEVEIFSSYFFLLKSSIFFTHRIFQKTFCSFSEVSDEEISSQPNGLT
jgi:hypothetical protein